MRNKELCRRCFIRPYIEIGESPASIKADNIFFDMLLGKGTIPCRYFASGAIKVRSVKEAIPDSCPYVVEHLVSQ